MGTTNNRKIESEHPPIRELVIPYHNKKVKAATYKNVNKDDSINVKNIVQQNNFTNTHLNTIGKQLSRIERHIQNPIVPQTPIERKLKKSYF